MTIKFIHGTIETSECIEWNRLFDRNRWQFDVTPFSPFAVHSCTAAGQDVSLLYTAVLLLDRTFHCCTQLYCYWTGRFIAVHSCTAIGQDVSLLYTAVLLLDRTFHCCTQLYCYWTGRFIALWTLWKALCTYSSVKSVLWLQQLHILCVGCVGDFVGPANCVREVGCLNIAEFA